MEGPGALDRAGIERVQALLGELQRLVDWLHGRLTGSRVPDDAAADSGLTGKGLLYTLKLILARALYEPASLASHYAAFAGLVLDAVQQKLDLEAEPGDRRFRDPLWHTSPLHRTLLQIYLAWQRTLGEWTSAQRFTQEDDQRVRFVLHQLVAALAPSNLPLNPAALRRAETTEGASVIQGVKQWADDLVHRRGMPQQIRPDAFEVGVDLALTPGAVVYRDALFELIQYKSLTPTVHRKPLMLVPPQINKFYVFDLRPENSMFRYLVGLGFQLFCLSWRNPDASMSDAGLAQYVQATLQGIDIVRSISRSASIGLVSACAGGFTALAALGLLAMRRERAVSHHTLLVTAPLSDNGSLLERLASREAMLASVEWSEQHGLMEGADLARIFAWLRPNDLVWNYWVNNYLLGRQPPRLDVLYWDNDSTRLPAALHRDFIMMADRRVFERPNTLIIAGTPIDFRRLRIDGYYVGGRDDYLMPWQGVYRAARYFAGRNTFLLSDSGHVQSILRPPRLGHTEHFARDDLPPDPQEWLAGACKHEGSWWPHWARWLAEHSGPCIKAPRELGSAAYMPIVAAPGEYVFER